MEESIFGKHQWIVDEDDHFMKEKRTMEQQFFYQVSCEVKKLKHYNGKVITIDQIPDEIFREHIFPCLRIEDLASQCALVCQRWYTNVKYSNVTINSIAWSIEKRQYMNRIIKSFPHAHSISITHNYDLIRYISENSTELKQLTIISSKNSTNEGHIVAGYLSSGKLFNLEELVLKDYELEERGFLHLTRSDNNCLRKLKTLKLADKKMSNHLVHLSSGSMVQLRTLVLSDCVIEEGILEKIFQGVNNLEKLSLDTTTHDPKCFNHIANQSSLKHLTISQLNEDCAKCLSSGKLTNLESLSIERVTVDDQVIEILSSGNLSITKLNLNYCTVSKNCLQGLSKGNWMSLKDFSLSGNTVMQQSIQVLSEGLFQLKRLSLPHCQLEKNQLQYFTSPVFNYLKILDLDYCSGVGNNLHILLECKSLVHHLRELLLRWTGITNQDMKSLKETINNQQLSPVSSSSTAPMFGNLTKLDLSYNFITDEGCTYLTECRGLYALKILKLKGNELLGDQCANQLIQFAFDRPSMVRLNNYSSGM